MEDSQRNGSKLNTLGRSRLNLFGKLRVLKGSSAADLDSYDYQPPLRGCYVAVRGLVSLCSDLVPGTIKS
jgi:hypothetical protein